MSPATDLIGWAASCHWCSALSPVFLLYDARDVHSDAYGVVVTPLAVDIETGCSVRTVLEETSHFETVCVSVSCGVEASPYLISEAGLL